MSHTFEFYALPSRGPPVSDKLLGKFQLRGKNAATPNLCISFEKPPGPLRGEQDEFV